VTSQKPNPLQSQDPFLQAIGALPPLPKTLRYEDDYDEKVRVVAVAEAEEKLTIYISGSTATLNFLRYDIRIRQLLRVYLLFSLQEMATISVEKRSKQLAEISAADIELCASSEPIDLKKKWPVFVGKYSSYALEGLRGLLRFLCVVRFMAWSTAYSQFISRALFIQQSGLYPSVRNGDAFLTIEEEARLVRWFDETALRTGSLDLEEIEVACLLVSSYQFGMRPKQLGILRKRDCAVRSSSEDHSVIVHLTFKLIKQRDPALSKLPLIRKVKREWAPLFARLMELKQTDGPDEFLFGFQSRRNLSKALSEQLAEILPGGERRIAYDLRHSMAQRLVDAGASHEDLATALGHTNLASGLIYFQQSANQAELVNKALGLSEVYQAVARIAKNKSISLEYLAQLKGDQQIGGAPHGIPIAGIGGCQSGQSSCPYNPVTACYGCPKFMPVRDVALHEQVLTEFRGVVKQFKDADRGDASSPTFLQLQRTISEIQATIHELEGVRDE
jgi:integrase